MYALNIQGSGTFEIRPEHVMKKEGSGANMSGWYIIGIHGTSK